MNSKNNSRYTVSSDEDYEPNSNNQVLKNYLNVKSTETIEALETQELMRAELESFRYFDENHQFTAADICDIHELWLGDIYPSAGKYRSVNLEKNGFLFAPAVRIPDLMIKFEKDFLAKHTPCHYEEIDALAYALGAVHVELILVHPFREGNGRVARLLAGLMAMQAKKPPLDFNPIDKIQNPEGYKKYILAIHAGLTRNYAPIQEIFKFILNLSIT